jgi:uncharacterized protein
VSELTLTEPASDPTTAAAPPPSARWGFWGTCAWGIGAFAAFYLTQFVVLVGIAIWWDFDPANPPPDFKAFDSNAIVVSFTTLACLPVTFLVLALSIRLARVRVVDYLALTPIDAKTMLHALACTFGYGGALALLTYVAGGAMTTPFVTELNRSAQATGTLALVLLAVVVAAPLTEELLFRGFLFRGFAASRLGAVGATVVTAAIWAGIHVQYDWLGIGEIFGLGLLFGYLRVRTGSTLTTILMHGAYGLAAMIQAAIFAG